MIHKTNQRRLLPAILILALLYLPYRVSATPASNAIVNAESFLIIDETVGSADLSLEFGTRIYKTLTYERAAARFRFNDSLYVAGSLSVQGRISLSGSTLTVNGSGSGKVSLQGLDGGKVCVLDTDGVGYTVMSANDGVLAGRMATGGECP